MALFCVLCEIQRVIGGKSQKFYNRFVFSAPAGGDPVGVSQSCLISIQPEWLGYRVVKKIC